MKYLVIKTNNNGEMKPWAVPSEQLATFQGWVDGPVEPVRFRDSLDHLLLVNEEGLIRDLPRNPIATWLAKEMGYLVDGPLRGNAVLIRQEGEHWVPPSSALCYGICDIWGWQK